MRDLALALLISREGLDVEEALAGGIPEMRPFMHPESGKTIVLLPGLGREGFRTIYEFAKKRVWPLTSRGLFAKLSETGPRSPDSLKETFFLSKEFHEIEHAFGRLPFLFTKEMLLTLLLDGKTEGRWGYISRVARQIRDHPAGEFERVGAFLAGIEESKIAAHWLVLLDPDYPYGTYSNGELIRLIELLDPSEKKVIPFLKRIEGSLRPAEVREHALRKLKESPRHPDSGDDT